MYQSPLLRQRQNYRHEAFFWSNPAEFTEALGTFVEDGLSAGEPVMVALIPEHADWLRGALGADAAGVTFVDMAKLGRNPARIIPAWQEFLERHVGLGRPTRGVGEPIWVGRRDDEILECQLHEALLNVAFDPRTPFWLICPYDSERLPAAVTAEADRSHPAIIDLRSYRGSSAYQGRTHVDSLFCADLPLLSGRPTEQIFTAALLQDVFALVLRVATGANLWSDQALALATSARELAEDSLSRGADRGIVRLWDQAERLVCEITDSTSVDDQLAGRRGPADQLHRGLRSANEQCALVQMRSNPSGTAVRLHAWK